MYAVWARFAENMNECRVNFGVDDPPLWRVIPSCCFVYRWTWTFAIDLHLLCSQHLLCANNRCFRKSVIDRNWMWLFAKQLFIISSRNSCIMHWLCSQQFVAFPMCSYFSIGPLYTIHKFFYLHKHVWLFMVSFIYLNIGF